MSDPGSIVCVGAHMQALFMHVAEIPREGETVIGWGYTEPADGGKASNIAVAAARLGAPVGLVTVVGDDQRAGWWRRRFADEGVDTACVFERPGPTDVGIVLLPSTKVPAIVSVADLTQTLTAEMVDDARDTILGASVVVGVLESPQSGIRRAFEIAREARISTVLVPSPPIEVDPALAEATNIVVCNEHEAAVLTGLHADPVTIADELRVTMGASVAIVTAGASGAFVSQDGQGSWHLAAETVSDVVDTTGAGDAFAGGLVVALHNGASLRAAVAFAGWVAGYSVRGRSTMDSFPTQANVRAAGLGTPAKGAQGGPRDG